MSDVVKVDQPATVVQLQPDGMSWLLARCRAFRVAVHSGGNRIWPAHLSTKFGAVFTFEPDIERLIDLMAETTRPNVFAMRAMLGDHFGPATLTTIKGPVTVPMIRIDDLALEHCDAIVIDDAAQRPHVLAGAARTMERFSPVVMVERRVVRRADLVRLPPSCQS